MSAEPKWTRGPWSARWLKDGERHRVNIVQDTRPLARILAPLPQWFLDGDLDSEEYHEHAANARLIAAAPDLYEALEDMMALGDCDDKHTRQKARAALARARGEAP